MVEYWNVDFLKKNLSFLIFPIKMDFNNKPLPHFPRAQYSIIPIVSELSSIFECTYTGRDRSIEVPKV